MATRKFKARHLPALVVHYTVTWDGKTVLAARPGWGPQARHYTFYKLSDDDGREHRIRGAEVIHVELADPDSVTSAKWLEG